jgi:hypothetical protein
MEYAGGIQMKKKMTFDHPRKLASQREEAAALPDAGDEIYCNGVFCFNITAMLEWMKQNPQPTVEMQIDVWGSFDGKEDCYVEAADLTRPIVIEEIAPDYRDFVPDIPEHYWTSRGYVCVDGQHRLEKARRLGVKTLPAVVIRMEQHIPFLYRGYDQYADYWNRKLKDRTEDALRWQRGTTQ